MEESLVDSEGHLINTWADILNRAGTGWKHCMRGMHTEVLGGWDIYSIAAAHEYFYLAPAVDNMVTLQDKEVSVMVYH